MYVSLLSCLGKSSTTKYNIFFPALNLKLSKDLTFQNDKKFFKKGTDNWQLWVNDVYSNSCLIIATEIQNCI